MFAKNNTVPEIVARYIRNIHREEFEIKNFGIPVEVLAVVYFRRATSGKWWYSPNGKMDLTGDRPRWVPCAPDNAHWYEIPVCHERIKKISENTREKYRELINKWD